ncbi:2-C-methyl-D-erythritol 4-phosphate cytidylyltransferase [Streptomyces sp. NTH33]|uniref:IspD/TarI family cytidylyltransferase n=1 Tax=Streptomyces sp. NTH33 TaxID=1735453 RepID=UPI000DA7232B|nr:IspD/TarI family cytidylyltransferase [Streptomyces sp. NTH33]PZH12148.1 2-C-methyl-D-erythritol 4-phosphate cytidylyltransferase [Streptomyces sp. NTH33]
MNIALLFAGGIGTRMNSRALPKQFLEIHGKPIIIHTLEHFEAHPDIDGIAIAILPEYRQHLMKLLKRYEIEKVRWVVDGGKTGQESRHNALKTVAADCPEDAIVLIHDGVRPLIDAKLISANIETVREHGSAITCTKFNETVVSSEHEHIDDVIPRDHIYAAQAPQSFRLGQILSLYDRAVAEDEHDTIDSCSLMHRYGEKIYRVVGPRSNIKITTAEDFYLCRTFFEIIENQQIVGT